MDRECTSDCYSHFIEKEVPVCERNNVTIKIKDGLEKTAEAL
jgi:hypothetical protein